MTKSVVSHLNLPPAGRSFKLEETEDDTFRSTEGSVARIKLVRLGNPRRFPLHLSHTHPFVLSWYAVSHPALVVRHAQYRN